MAANGLFFVRCEFVEISLFLWGEGCYVARNKVTQNSVYLELVCGVGGSSPVPYCVSQPLLMAKNKVKFGHLSLC